MDEEEEVDAEDEDYEDYEEEEDDDDDEDLMREIVVPGEELTDDMENFVPGRGTTYNTDKSKIISLHIGLKQVRGKYVNVIPLKGLYTPQPGDKIIALVVDKNPVKYKCDINAKDFGQLKPKNTIKRSYKRGGRGGGGQRSRYPDTDMFDIGDILVAKVLSADRLNKPELTTVGKYLGKKTGGLCISIDPPKIPRIIGRKGSMIKMLKNLTSCNIFVTQNGRIWLKGDSMAHEQLLIDAVKKIQREAHTFGLTDRIEEYIKNEKEKRGL